MRFACATTTQCLQPATRYGTVATVEANDGGRNTIAAMATMGAKQGAAMATQMTNEAAEANLSVFRFEGFQFDLQLSDFNFQLVTYRTAFIFSVFARISETCKSKGALRVVEFFSNKRKQQQSQQKSKRSKYLEFFVSKISDTGTSNWTDWSMLACCLHATSLLSFLAHENFFKIYLQARDPRSFVFPQMENILAAYLSSSHRASRLSHFADNCSFVVCASFTCERRVSRSSDRASRRASRSASSAARSCFVLENTRTDRQGALDSDSQSAEISFALLFVFFHTPMAQRPHKSVCEQETFDCWHDWSLALQWEIKTLTKVVCSRLQVEVKSSRVHCLLRVSTENAQRRKIHAFLRVRHFECFKILPSRFRRNSVRTARSAYLSNSFAICDCFKSESDLELLLLSRAFSSSAHFDSYSLDRSEWLVTSFFNLASNACRKYLHAIQSQTGTITWTLRISHTQHHDSEILTGIHDYVADKGFAGCRGYNHTWNERVLSRLSEVVVINSITWWCTTKKNTHKSEHIINAVPCGGRQNSYSSDCGFLPVWNKTRPTRSLSSLLLLLDT